MITKNRVWMVIGVLIILGIVGLLVWMQQVKKETELTDAVRFHQNYPGVPKDNRFVYASSEDILEIFEEGTGLVFLGFPECPWCQKLAPLTNEAAIQSNLDKIYYLNIQDARTKNSVTYQKLIEYLKEYLQTDEDGNPRIYVPDLTAISNGEIVSRFTQEKAEGSLTPDEYWTEARKESAIKQIKEMIVKMNQSKFSQIENELSNGNAILLDVRSPEEFASGHFAGAVNLDVEEIAQGALPEKPKDSKIYLYCRSGNRSAEATSMLKQEGFTNIIDLGGLSQVEEMGGKLIKS